MQEDQPSIYNKLEKKETEEATDRLTWCSSPWKIAIITALCIIVIVDLALIWSINNTNITIDTGDSEVDYEQDYINYVDAERINQSLYYYTQAAHQAGSPFDYELATWTQNQMIEAGIPDVSIEEHVVLLSFPISRNLQIIGSNYQFLLNETVYPEDPTSSLGTTPTYLGYAPSKTAVGQVVYVNYGTAQDFEDLWNVYGVNITGHIAIMRYGQISRGQKVINAYKQGAIGALIYSDPADDGYGRGTPYIEGPWRPQTGVQRGTIYRGNGDPLTPGVPSIEGSPRISLDDAYDPNKEYGTPLPNIPALPLSWGDALPILSGLQGTDLTSTSWKGDLNITYFTGPGPLQVNLSLEMNFTETTVWNVIGKITGAIEPDRIVLVGNHRDAWVFGAVDPNSGSSVLLELATGLGHLLDKGWEPRRSIWLCSWDAEEFGLIGSTEFVEWHEKILAQKAVAYLNVDIAVSGIQVLNLGGSPSLGTLSRDITAQVPSPNPNSKTMFDCWQLTQNLSQPPPQLSAQGLGTSSDYGAFFHHSGISILDFNMANTPDAYDGVYHSNYDSYYWVTHFGDPEFLAHKAVAQTMGLFVIRLSSDDLLPFDFVEYYDVLNAALVQLETTYQTTNLDWSTLETALENLQSAANAMNEEKANLDQGDSLALRQVNDRLFLAERGLLFLQGYAGKEWYRHLLWYNGEAFGTIIDSLDNNQNETAQYQIQLVAILLNQMADYLLSS